MISMKSVNLNSVNKRFQNISNDLKLDIARRIGLRTEKHAESKAPHYSGELRKALHSYEIQKGYRIQQKQPANSKRPYHLMMAGYKTPNISHLIKSGDPHYMENARYYALSIIDEEIDNSLKKPKPL